MTAMLLCLFAGCNPEEEPYIPTGDGLSDQIPNQTDPPPQQTEQKVTLVYDPDSSLNPFTATAQNNRALLNLVYQGLFTVDRSYKARPILCQSYNVSADMETYTFQLANARFSDGTILTAADVAASLEAARKSPWYGGRLQQVDSIRALGNTVIVELKTAMADLPLLLDIPIVKASQVEAEQPLGTGPYRFDGAQLRKVAGWWCSAKLAVRSDTVSLVPAKTPAQIRDSFEFGGSSLVVADPGAWDYVEYHNDYELWDTENGLFLYLVCNEKSKVFSNAELRAALTYAIDRETLASTYYRGFAQSATLPCSPQAPWYNSALAAKYGYAPQVFQEALKDLELPETPVTLLVNGADGTRVKAANAIAGELTRLGLQVTVVKASGAEFTKLLAKGEYDLYLAQTRLSRNMDISAFFGMDTALNYGGLSDPGIYNMSLEALANAGNYYTLYEMVMEDAQLFPILFQSSAVYAQRGVFENLNPVRDTVFYYDLGRSLEDALLRE